MKEKEIRERIERFLQKTARNIVVPASVGMGLSAAGCDQHALHSASADAGRDVAVQADAANSWSDAATSSPDATGTGPDLTDASAGNDLPVMVVPYLMAMQPDTGPDVAADLARDLVFEAGAAQPDTGSDLVNPMPAYLFFSRTQRDQEEK